MEQLIRVGTEEGGGIAVSLIEIVANLTGEKKGYKKVNDKTKKRNILEIGVGSSWRFFVSGRTRY